MYLLPVRTHDKCTDQQKRTIIAHSLQQPYENKRGSSVVDPAAWNPPCIKSMLAVSDALVSIIPQLR